MLAAMPGQHGRQNTIQDATKDNVVKVRDVRVKLTEFLRHGRHVACVGQRECASGQAGTVQQQAQIVEVCPMLADVSNTLAQFFRVAFRMIGDLGHLAILFARGGWTPAFVPATTPPYRLYKLYKDFTSIRLESWKAARGAAPITYTSYT